MDKAIITCAINGVLTNPEQHNVAVTPEQMAATAKEAQEAGAAIVHIHYRQQAAGMGHLPSWEPEIAAEMAEAIRAACPGLIINSTSGVIGPDYQGALDCLRSVKPEISACNAGTLNYLKIRSNGDWAWPPMIFDNSVAKIKDYLDVINEIGSFAEMECFDVGIVRSVGMYLKNGMVDSAYYNFVMGVASGMPADPDLLPILQKYIAPGSKWEATVIGRQEIWPVHQKVAEMGGMLRTGVEDTFYLPDGEKTSSNGKLIEQLAVCAKNAGRAIASPDEARDILGLKQAA
jgi:uncharacterized protein (DUF849 family)